MRRTSLLVVALLAGGAAVQPLAAAESRISEVTLSSGGLAEIVRTVEATDGGAVEIEVPLEQVDDVLKSLVVLGGGATVGQLTLAGASGAAEIMRTMPFSSEEMKSLALLLDALQGTPVEVTGAGRELRGTILGVTRRPSGDDGAIDLLALMLEDGTAETIELDPGVSVRILDEAVRDKIREAAGAAGRAKADGARTISISLDGVSAGGQVRLGYVVAAPIWKTAYRVVTEESGDAARLQAWAVLENATGDDWDGVRLTLSSGAPVTLTQRLHERYWRERHEVPVDVAGSPLPRADTGAMARSRLKAQDDAEANRAIGRPMAAEVAPSPMASMAGAADTAAATESDVTATFAVRDPVDLEAGDTLSLPIVDREVPAERVSLFQRGVAGSHPVAALMLTNDTGTSLPPGILTVYDAEAGYVGDAQLLGMPPGEERMVSFAADRKVTIDATDRPERRVRQIRFVDGVLRVTVADVARTVYRIENDADVARSVVIEHPRRAGWEFVSDALVGTTPSHRRLEVEVAAGGQASVEAVQTLPRQETFALADASPDLFVEWASEAGDEDLAAKLRNVAEARAEMAGTERQLDDAGEALDRLVAEQGRIRSNLAAVPGDSPLRRRYLDELTRQEDRIGEMRDERERLEGQLEEQRSRLEEELRTF